MKHKENYTLTEWALFIHEWAKEKGWWEELNEREVVDVRAENGKFSQSMIHLMGTKLALVHSEVSEALECLRSGDILHKNVVDKHGQLKPEGFETEIADTIIRLLDLAGALKIDIGYEVTSKMAFNGDRPFRHGNRLA